MENHCQAKLKQSKKENKIEVVDDKDNVNQALIDMIDNPKVTKNKDDEDNVN